MGTGSSKSCGCGARPRQSSTGSDDAAPPGPIATVEQAISLFNTKPKKGVAYAIEHGLCAEDPSAVAKLLHDGSKKLDKVQVGEYLGEHADFNQKVLAQFVRGVPLGELGFDDALRLFLSAFRLPGEAQKIDRFMEVFAAEFSRTHPDEFAKPDTPCAPPSAAHTPPRR